MRSAAAAHVRTTADADFADYLEAKFALDERSLNVAVREACIRRLAARSSPLRWLDVGSGTGAMVRRLLDSDLRVPLSITVLDHDASLLAIASEAISTQLGRQGYRARTHANRLEADNPVHQVRVDFQCSGLFEFEPAEASRYDLITAHAFIDIVPIAPVLARLAQWLTRGGMLYATLNYDGDTALFPAYRDAPFEDAVLAEYDASMERRRVQGASIGGARSGRRLHSRLRATGFDVIAYGSSDWNITPCEGRYRDRDADVLRTLLPLIRGESERQPSIERAMLEDWYTDRWARLESNELGMIVHQLDVLATQRRGLTAFA